jgi:MFS family permease
MNASPRGWYHGWSIVAVCILMQAVANGLTYNAFSLFLSDWSAQLHAPVSRFHLSVAAMALLASLAAPGVGVLADKLPARRLLVGGLLGIATFYFLTGSVRAIWQFSLLYGLLAPFGLVFSTAVPANALISRWFRRRLGLALGLSAFGIGMAGVLLPPLIAAILPRVGWRLIWQGSGVVVAALVVPLVLLVVRDRPTEEEGAYYLGGESGAHGPHSGRSGRGGLSWREVARRRNFWLLVALYVPMLALHGGCSQNLGPFTVNHGLSQQSAGTLLSVISFSHVISQLGLGLLADRFGTRLPFFGLALVTALGAVVLALGSGLPTLIVGCALVGLGGGVFTLLAAAIAVEFGAEGVGRAFGLAMLFVPLTALAPFIVAKTQENTGSYAPALIGMAIVVLATGSLSLLLRERRGGQSAGAELQPTASGTAP